MNSDVRYWKGWVVLYLGFASRDFKVLNDVCQVLTPFVDSR